MTDKSKQKWTILGVYTLGSIWNGFTFSNFGGNVEVVKEAYDIGTAKLNFIYSVIFITVGISFVPIMLYAERYNWIVVNVGTVSGCLATWIRLASIEIGSYPLAVLSSVFIGFQSAVICGTFVFIAERWFEPSKRALATQLTLQGNYAGWALGAVVAPYLGNEKSSLTKLFLIQAINMTIATISIFMFYRSPPRPQLQKDNSKLQGQEKKSVGSSTKITSYHGEGDNENKESHPPQNNINHHHHHHSEEEDHLEDHNRSIDNPIGSNLMSYHLLLGQGSSSNQSNPFYTMFQTRNFFVLFLGLAMMTGIGFALPALQQEQLHSLQFSSEIIGWSSFLFITSGVLFGVILGHYLKSWKQCSELLLPLFVVGSISLTIMFAMQYGSKHYFQMSKSSTFAVTLFCMFFAGGSTLSALGVGMRIVVHITHPLSDIYTSSVIQFGIQCVSASLPMVAIGKYGYAVLVGVAWTATLLVALGLRSPTNTPT
jgi:hypothetical protein